jgi:fatty-acyl-CoA synthase/long-chain acyl-CoA synthetase
MPDILTTLAAAMPNKVAVIDDRPKADVVSWTFAELEARANVIANSLIELGAEPGMRVLWCGQNSASLVAIINACRKVGVVAVPLNYRLTPDEAAYIVDNSDTVIAFCDLPYAELFAGIRNRTPKLREVLIFDGEPLRGQRRLESVMAGMPSSPPDVDSARANPGTMIYTSGTTGVPKGAVRTGAGDPSLTAQLLALIGYRSDDVYITTGPLYHSGPGGFMSIAQSLGNTVVLQHKFDAEDWCRLVDHHRVTSTFSAPTPIRLVTQLPDAVLGKYRLDSMRVMIANAAPWSFALKKAYLARFPAQSLFEVYGSTELGVNTVLRPEDQLRKPGSCGKAAPGVEIALFDDAGKRVEKVGEPGELYVRSASVFNTYHKAQDKYEAEMRGDWHTVGDVAYVDDEGFYFICDRKKDMIISGGVNIYPAEIEAALEQHPDVQDVAVFGIPSDEWGESVHAMVVARSGSGLNEPKLIEFARRHLAGYKVPRSVKFIEEVPRNASGKILKRVMRDPYWQGRRSRVN